MSKISICPNGRTISTIHIGNGAAPLMQILKNYQHIYAVIDSNVKKNCTVVHQMLHQLEKAGVSHLAVDASEQKKDMNTVMDICAWLLEKGANRDALLLAIGGGITSDMAGFAASIYKRGIRFAYVPTTLLSQVDAAIGGKTGVNFHDIKNILGIIRQQDFTYICPEPLQDLPQRDFLSGAAELLKTFIIEDNGNYTKAVDLLFDISGEYHVEVLMNGKDENQTWRTILKNHNRQLGDLIEAAAKVKAGVVSRDQFEKGERRKLNLGHTFAHAIETLARQDGSDITHGEAVAMGIVLAARLSDRYFRKDKSETTELESRLQTELWDCNIPCFCPYSVEQLADAMRKDKKAQGGKVHFVLIKEIGDVVTQELTVEEACRLMASPKN